MAWRAAALLACLAAAVAGAEAAVSSWGGSRCGAGRGSPSLLSGVPCQPPMDPSVERQRPPRMRAACYCRQPCRRCRCRRPSPRCAASQTLVAGECASFPTTFATTNFEYAASVAVTGTLPPGCELM